MGAPGTPQIMRIDKILKRACPEILGRVFPEKKKETPAGGHLDHQKLVNHNKTIRKLPKVKIPRSKGMFRLIFHNFD